MHTFFRCLKCLITSVRWQNADFEVPASFRSKLSKFKDKLQVLVEDVFDFVTMPKQDTLPEPRNFGHFPYIDLITDNKKPV